MIAREKELLAAARAGDHTAFSHICAAHRADLLALCQRFVPAADDAQDIVQEVFFRAWQNLAGYRGDASLRTWFWEIARNLCLNHLRARKSQLSRNTVSADASPDSERQAMEIPDSRPTPEAQILDRAQHEHLRAELTRCAAARKWERTDWELFQARIDGAVPYADFAQAHGRDEAYWRNRWRDKIKPTLEQVRRSVNYFSG